MSDGTIPILEEALVNQFELRSSKQEHQPPKRLHCKRVPSGCEHCDFGTLNTPITGNLGKMGLSQHAPSSLGVITNFYTYEASLLPKGLLTHYLFIFAMAWLCRYHHSRLMRDQSERGWAVWVRECKWKSWALHSDFLACRPVDRTWPGDVLSSSVRALQAALRFVHLKQERAGAWSSLNHPFKL